MIGRISRIVASWRFARQLNRNLAARRQLRTQRRRSALKGWETRRAQ